MRSARGSGPNFHIVGFRSFPAHQSARQVPLARGEPLLLSESSQHGESPVRQNPPAKAPLSKSAARSPARNAVWNQQALRERTPQNFAREPNRNRSTPLRQNTAANAFAKYSRISPGNSRSNSHTSFQTTFPPLPRTASCLLCCMTVQSLQKILEKETDCHGVSAPRNDGVR